MEQNSRQTFLINLLYFLSISLIVFIVLRFMMLYLLPFVFGGIIAYLVQKPSIYISKKTRLNQNIIASVLAVGFYILVIGIIFIIVYLIIIYSSGFLTDLPLIFVKSLNFLTEFKNTIMNGFNSFSGEFQDGVNTVYDNAMKGILAKATDFISNFATDLAKKIPSFSISVATSIVASCFLAKDYRRLLNFFKLFAGKKIYKNIKIIKIIFKESILKFIKGYLIIMLVTFFELSVGFLIINIKYSIIIALVISLVDILPIFGCGTVLVPWIVIEFATKNSEMGIKLGCLYLIISLVRNFLEPKIIGKQMGINPLLTLVAMFVGLKLFGFFGLLFLPITIIVIIKYYKYQMDDEIPTNYSSN